MEILYYPIKAKEYTSKSVDSGKRWSGHRKQERSIRKRNDICSNTMKRQPILAAYNQDRGKNKEMKTPKKSWKKIEKNNKKIRC